jgi:hypothetical protein
MIGESIAQRALAIGIQFGIRKLHHASRASANKKGAPPAGGAAAARFSLDHWIIPYHGLLVLPPGDRCRKILFFS